EDAARTVADVEALIRSVAPATYLPLDDQALWLARDLDPAAVTVAGPVGEVADYALDKHLQIQAAEAAGLLVPPTTVRQSLDGFEPPDYPVVVKAARALYHDGRRLVRPTGSVVSDPAELAEAMDRPWLPPILVQPLIHGIGEGLFGHVSNGQ